MNTQMTVQNALRKVETSDDGKYGVLLERGSMQLGFYKPGKIDPQNPHDQDEIYMIGDSLVIATADAPGDVNDTCLMPVAD